MFLSKKPTIALISSISWRFPSQFIDVSVRFFCRSSKFPPLIIVHVSVNKGRHLQYDEVKTCNPSNGILLLLVILVKATIKIMICLFLFVCWLSSFWTHCRIAQFAYLYFAICELCYILWFTSSFTYCWLLKALGTVTRARQGPLLGLANSNPSSIIFLRLELFYSNFHFIYIDFKLAISDFHPISTNLLSHISTLLIRWRFISIFLLPSIWLIHHCYSLMHILREFFTLWGNTSSVGASCFPSDDGTNACYFGSLHSLLRRLHFALMLSFGTFVFDQCFFISLGANEYHKNDGEL